MALAWAIEGPSEAHRSSESESETEKETEKESDTRARENPHRRSAGPPVPLATAIEDLGPDVRSFIAVHWPKRSTPARRRAEVAKEILATLNGGALYKGQRVFAYSIDRLAAKCREVIRDRLEDPDKAMAVLLIKLGDTSDGSAPGVAEAAAIASDTGDDNVALVAEWEAQNPFEAQLLYSEIADQHGDPNTVAARLAIQLEFRSRVLARLQLPTP